MRTPPRNKVGFELFLSLWNTQQTASTPRHHAKIATWLEECWARGERRLLLMAFRASGKSTIVAAFSAWLLYRDPDLRILVLSAEASLAARMVRNIRKIIERHPLTATLKPRKADQWASDRFTVSRARDGRDPSVVSAGLNSNITGYRADIIICDDVEVPGTCDTAGKRESLRERLTENEFILVPGGCQIYIGTPHAWDTIYADTPRAELGQRDVFLKNYARFSLPILDDDGHSTWPERYDVHTINDMRAQAGPNKFASQMMLTPVNIAEGRLDPALLKPYAAEIVTQEVQRKLYLSLGDKKLVSCSAWWDPSFAGDKNDASVLAVVYTDEDGDYWLHRVIYIRAEKSEADEATVQCRQVAAAARDFFIPSITVETNGIGKFLPAILKRELAAARVPCAVVEAVSTKAKDVRILESFDAVMAARALNVHRSVYDTGFIREMQEWRPGLKGARDDGLDAVAGALAREPIRLRRTYFAGRQDWRGT